MQREELSLLSRKVEFHARLTCLSGVLKCVNLASDFRAVTGKRTQSLLHNPARRARVLAVVLLASIAWSATAEFTHHHGVQSAAPVGALLSQAQALNVSDQTSAPRIESGETERSSSRSTSAADCLICQLQQNLSATLVNSPPRVATVDIHVVRVPAMAIVQLSEFATNQHGRAPPINL